jgi:hypothetical protein
MATAAIHDRLEQDLQALVQALNLTTTTGATGSVGQNVLIQQLEDSLGVPTWPAVIVTAQGLAEEEGDSNFEDDVVIYPVLILVCDSARGNAQAARPDYLAWRRQIAATLRGLVNYPLLTSTPECHDVRVRDLPALPDSAAVKQYVVQGLVAECHTNELRIRG